MNRVITLAAAVLALVLLCGMMTGCRRESGATFYSEIELDLPWDQGGKEPSDYTWEEFEKLTPEQSIAFQNYLGQSGFETWMNSVKEMEQEQVSEVVSAPWEEAGAKQPEDYTWEEFEALTPEQSIAFQNYLGESGFETWMSSVKELKQEQASEVVSAPWEEAGSKQPADYTWEEFEALTPEQSIAFQNYLGESGFETWMSSVKELKQEQASEVVSAPWEEAGAKQPADYTWEEFEALTPELSILFQNSFESGEAFEAWMRKVRDDEENTESPMEELELPWNEEGAKQPAEYTWEEFEALDGILQIAFQNSFEGFEAFDKWLQNVNPQ